MTREHIAELRKQQEQLRAFADEGHAPKVLFFADDESVAIVGNESGLIRLALEILEVSAGGQVSPDISWLDSPWLPLEAITLDPNPSFENKKATFWQTCFFFLILATIFAVFTVGVIVTGQWLTHWIHI